MESVANGLLSYFQRNIRLIFYTILSCLVYNYVLRPIYNALYPIYYYQRFHCLPRKFLFGNVFEFIPNFPLMSTSENVGLNADATFDKLVNTSKDRSANVVWFGPIPLVLLSDHEAVEAVKSTVKKPFFYRFLFMRNGLVTSPVALWKIRRKAIEPFHVTKKQRRFVKTMDEEIRSFPKLLTKYVGKPVDIEHPIYSSSLNVILKVSASIPLDAELEAKEEVLKVVEQALYLPLLRIFNPIYWIDSLLKYSKVGQLYLKEVEKIETMMDVLYNRRKKVLESSPPPDKEDHDLMHTLEPHTNKEGLHEELMTTIAAGHETVSIGLRWTLFLLGNHEDIQERVYREIIDYFPDDEPVNDLDKLNQCTYLEQCLNESLRLYPPIHTIGRVLTEDIMIKGKKILKGTTVAVCLKTTHRDPNVYPNPTKYDPERWNLENVKSIPKSAFVPFGIGPRNCIGYRYAMTIMKVYLVHVLRSYSIKSTRKDETIRTRLEVSNKPDSPLEIILSPRDNNNNNQSLES